MPRRALIAAAGPTVIRHFLCPSTRTHLAMPSLSRRTFLLRAGQTTAAAAAAFAAGPLAAGRAAAQGLAAAAQADAPVSALATILAGAAQSRPQVAGVPPLRQDSQPLPIPDGSSVPLETKIGQMIMVGFGGKVLDESSAIIQAMQAGRVGGVVLFRHNLAGAAQVREMTAALHAAAPIVPLISIDQEGGFVNRLGGLAGPEGSYSAQRLGDLHDAALTWRQGEATARALRNLGINLNLAPVVDLNLNPNNPVIGRVQRSYSASPEVVVEQASALIDAHRQVGVLTTLKHFPGHGSSNGDSHLGFVDVSETWQEQELAPFASLIVAGQADAVMTAHIFNSRLDPDLPATLSRATLTGILREKIGYDGVIISDDMRMRAISDVYSPEDALRLAVEAGVDILAISNNIPGKRIISADQAFDILAAHVASGAISPERIDASYQRILRLKSRIVVGEI